MAEMKEPSSVIREHHTLLQVSNSHGLQLLGVLRSFREQGLLFDFTIKVQERSFPCHRCVLAACSDFFRAMFEAAMRERDDGSVTLCNQFPVVVESFLDFAYSGEILITEENVDSLFQLASFLQVPVLSKACSDFLLETIDLGNCLSLLALAEAYGSASLLQSAMDFVVQNFQDLSNTQDFLDMQVNVLEECLRSDALCVPSEEAAVMSLLRWICQDIPGRQKLLPKLLSLTRLHHLPPHALQTLHESDLLSDNNSCMALISVAESRQSQHSGLFTDARPATTQSYIYIHKTEENGVVHHSFCYCLETDQWKELEMGQGQGMSTVPDPPGSHLTGYAEKMFVTGGCRGNCCRAVRIHVAEPFHDATDEVWCFSPVTRTCTPAPAMLKPRTMHTAVVCLERVYVIGGRTEGSRGASPSLLEVEYYDPLVKSWFSVSPLPTAIFYPEASVCGSIIYTLGSEMEITDSFNPSLDCFFSYDAQQDQWCRLVVEFCQFFHATLVKAMSVNETLHLCDLSTYKVYSFCPQTCVWKGEGSFECAGFNAGAVGIRDKIYILGGDYSPDEITDEVQVYHSDRSQWEEVAPMPRGLTEFHCQVISFNKHTNPWSDIE
ncbi:kelch repeat and BTB domain-containing protein 3 isoform X1 [Phyllopteryx taeniolatus]|uniref:kelch repeat and BTB domain-containing protein 3 isoform X1 n=1 Tax=Phyllopteryx taeniolatus TaxID=161469 RepID=UPI002AD3EA03|nr:kelch repeat and BTB domain-containing protein 3 isoform X1 [Phyllopteryx taeniolatus]XP_061637426.1 kelch repeat and BTB domain-containing protein 3 isoform X1 [Phyllopteryx taeniolatus]XP_061637428.1 kelch repeat and BTB domain-containing protein 3 isoform X1 [Phyllopteryx taeniolatus]